MAKKNKSKVNPETFKLAEILPQAVLPIAVKASDIDKVIVGLSPKTAANWRSQGIGPGYVVQNGQVYYPYEPLKDYFCNGTIKTQNQ